jgi:serine protease Do
MLNSTTTGAAGPASEPTRPAVRHPVRRLTTLGALAWALLAFGPPAWAQSGDATAPTDTPPIALRVEALKRAHVATLGVRSRAVDDAFSNETLGRQRVGSGVVIDANGLVLTISYLVLEAERVDIEVEPDRIVPARVVGLDIATGFALLRPLVPIDIPPVPLGSSARVGRDQPLMFSSSDQVSLARLVMNRPFSGSWEYHLDSALFTAPPRSDHSGAGLFNADGELVGIGSLVVRHAAGDDHPPVPGNMFVPVDLLKPILSELSTRGTTAASMRAWLGLNCAERDGDVRVVRVNRDSPAEAAGVQVGDRIVSIDGREVSSLETLYKTLWSGQAQRDVTVGIRRDGERRDLTVQSVDRQSVLRSSRGI